MMDPNTVHIRRGLNNTFDNTFPVQLQNAISESDFRNAMTRINEAAREFNPLQYAQRMQLLMCCSVVVFFTLFAVMGPLSTVIGINTFDMSGGMPTTFVFLIPIMLCFILVPVCIQKHASARMQKEATKLDQVCQAQNRASGGVTFSAQAVVTGMAFGRRGRSRTLSEIMIVCRIVGQSAAATVVPGVPFGQAACGGAVPFGQAVPVQAVATVAATPVTVAATPVAPSGGLGDQLTQLSNLHQTGALSAQEFENAKARLLGNHI